MASSEETKTVPGAKQSIVASNGVWRTALVLALLVLPVPVNLLWFHVFDNPFYGVDEAVQYPLGLQTAADNLPWLRDIHIQTNQFRNVFISPAINYFSLPLVAVFGLRHLSFAMTNTAVLVAAMMLLAFLFRRKEEMERIALCLAVLLSIPAIWRLSRIYYPDGTLIGLSLAFFAIWLRDAKLEKWSTTLLLGVLAGVGLLTKATFGAFIVAPLLLTLVAVFQQRPVAWRRLGNWALSAAVAGLIYAPWWLPRWRESVDDIISHTAGHHSTGQLMAEAVGPLEILGGFNVALLVLGLFFTALAWRRRLFRRESLALLLAFILPALYFWLGQRHTFVRQMVPALPPLALLVGAGIGRLQGKKTMAVLLFAVFLAAAPAMVIDFRPESSRENKVLNLPEMISALDESLPADGVNVTVLDVRGETVVNGAMLLYWLALERGALSGDSQHLNWLWWSLSRDEGALLDHYAGSDTLLLLYDDPPRPEFAAFLSELTTRLADRRAATRLRMQLSERAAAEQWMALFLRGDDPATLRVD
ncbi:MAG: glycosyltransferase family 39 protein [Candidatus Lernaella stagnicola]|nr:glycosyltransferase family 39 protein [Candidatus Lernaella stagnicola]